MAPYTRFFTTVDGAHIAYATLGAGPPLVYLPPFLSHLELMWEASAFRAFNTALAAHFTLIRYDRFGCGLSDRDRTDFSLDVDVRVLSDLIDHLRLRRVALLGASAGGPVAVRYAAANPRRVSHLLLFGMEWQPTPSTPVRNLVNQLIQADVRLGSTAYANYLIPGGDPEALAWFARILQEGTSAETAEGLSTTEPGVDLAGVLPTLRVPTLVMNRWGDRLVPLEVARELAARIPGAHFVALPGDDHITEFGDAGAVVDAIRAFVRAPGMRAPAEGAPEDTPPKHVGLSAREVEVLDLIASGSHQPGDRGPALAQRPHGRAPHRQPLHQAWRARAGGGDGLCPAPSGDAPHPPRRYIVSITVDRNDPIRRRHWVTTAGDRVARLVNIRDANAIAVSYS